MKDISLDELGACNNPRCPAGCGWYDPTTFRPGVPLAMTPCSVCGCMAGQHRDKLQSSVKPTPDPAPQAGTTFHSMHSSASSNFVPPVGLASNAGPSGPSTLPTSDFTFVPPAGPAFNSGLPAASGFGQPPLVPPTSTGFSATARTMASSRSNAEAGPSQPQRGRSPLRGSTAGPRSFINVANARKQDIQAAMRMSTPFHPALNAQREADLNRPGLQTKKRKRRDRDIQSPSRERNVKPKKVKQLSYVFIFVPFTKDINRRSCHVPAAHLLLRLEEAGYVKDIILGADDTVTQKQMRLDRLGQMIPKPGVPRIFRAYKRDSELDMTAIKVALTDSNVRFSGPRYKRIVFIAMNPTGPNLPLRGIVYDKGDHLDHDLPSDYSRSEASTEDTDSDSDVTMESDPKSDDNEQQHSDNESDAKVAYSSFVSVRHSSTHCSRQGKGKAKAPEPDLKGKKKASDEGSRFDAGFFDDDIAAGVGLNDDASPDDIPREPTIEKPVVPEAHHRMVRLLHNMEKPNSKATLPTSFWREDGVGCFLLGTKSAGICAGVLVQYLASPENSVLSAPQILSFIESNVCQPFLMLARLGGRLLGSTERIGTPEFEAEFDSAFAVGPGGLHGLAPHILPAYLALPVALAAGASSAAASAVYDKLTDFSYALLRCLQNLRFKHDRSLWDPSGGCRELATILLNKDSALPVATEEDFNRLNMKLLIQALDKESPNVSEISFLLMDALGDASNPREMTAERVLKGGEYGMRRFYNLVVVPVLDDLDTAHPDYPSVLGSIKGSTGGAARKIRNHFKSGSSSTKSGPSSSGPNTRSRSKRTTGKFDENPDDMTNTDSLESGWENDCSGGEPDISARRAARAQQQAPKPQRNKSPPIEISSESDSSDSEWTRTYAQWKKQTHTDPSHEAPPTAGPSNTGTTSQSRAQPAWLDSHSLEDDDIEDATGLLRRPATRYWQGVMREIVERFPHPDPARQLTIDMLLAPGMTRTKQYHMLSLAYHVDRNVGGPAHWLRVAGILSQILNDTRKYKLDDPRIVPRDSRF
ncbi:hypothetical protein B0H13DRAFT_1857350 [Mycena leptocephala]|nr:hypothetical protein B0H13DRAFT_1857350 [Mycena leptocephala]